MELREVFQIAISAIRANKLRSSLTLLGVAVGVFSIIGVMTAVRVLQNSIESGLSVLGTHTFQIQKFPVIRMGGHSAWAKYRNRKNITYLQALEVQERMTNALYVGIEGWQGGKVVQAGGNKTNPNVSVAGETPEGLLTNNWTVAEGGGFNEGDIQTAARVAILGDAVAKKVFPRGGAVGSDVRIDAYRFTVIGVFEPKGSIFGGNQDNFVAIPLSTFLNTFGKERSLNIMIKAKSPDVYEDAIEEARLILRRARNVEPGAEDDFEIFSNDSLIEQFNELTFYVKLGVGFISVIALLAAGVGIMNIMLVSVTERTREIGIRKAVGAQNRNILAQFLAEAVVLCQFGGIVGIVLGILGGNLTALALQFPPIVPLDWALIGFALCSVIGIAFGVYPAWKASNLDPIDALRYE